MSDPAITRFRGPYRFLSNFWPCEVELGGLSYPSVEHAYQAAKTRDPAERLSVLNADSPGQAKRLGRQIRLRADWEDVKEGVMRDLLRQKFADPDLRRRLLETGDAELIEGNTWGDTWWGCVWDGEAWQGQNRLGHLLMEVRTAAITKDESG